MLAYKGGPSKQKTYRGLLTALPYLVVLISIFILPYAVHAGEVSLSWNASTSAGVAGYKIYFGTASRSYSGYVDVGNKTSFTISTLAEGTVYYFAATAYGPDGTESAYSNEVSKTAIRTSPLLSHYKYSYAIGGQPNCGLCHIQKGTFLSGFGVRTSLGLCYSCHSAAGAGHERPIGGKNSHPILVNVTADSSHRKPTLGFVNGTSSDKTYTHLFKGKKVVCMTCHNSKRKPGDPGRSWELTTTTDNITYRLQYGGWTHDAYLKPVVYRSMSLWLGPTFLRDAKQYIVSQDEYDIDMAGGAIIFHQAQPSTVYIYVTLLDEYLRSTNVNNQLCLDCHIITTHKQYDCTICHGTHNTDNLKNIRQQILSPQGRANSVFFMSTTAMSGKNGVCVVCHTRTKYHNMTSVSPVSHYDKRNCTDCHMHRLGFPK